MSEKTKADALGALATFLDESKSVMVGGQKFELSKLRPIDLAKARDYVVQTRVERHLGTTRYMNLEPTVRAKVLAELETAPLSLYDVMQDVEGRLKLIHLSVERAGAKMSLSNLREGLDPVNQDELFAYVLWISGVIDEPAGGEEDGPLATPADTMPSLGT